MSTQVNYHLLKESLVINYEGKTFSLAKEDALYEKVLDCIREERLGDIPELVSVEEKLKKIDPSMNFLVEDGVVYSYGNAVEPYLAERLIELHALKLPITPLVNFWKKAMKNPSDDSRKDLFRFVEHNQFPITPDGNIIAYKRVDDNFKDFYTHSIDNSIGTVVKMDRKDVNPNRSQECSTGLHVAGYDYARFSYHSGSGNMVDVEINPKHVVSVPTDYNSAKCRVCKYKVIGISGGEIKNAIVEVKEEVIKDHNGGDEVVRDDRQEKNIDSFNGEVAIGRAVYKVKDLTVKEFDAELERVKYKKICRYDQAKFFKEAESTRVYRTKESEKFRYLEETAANTLRLMVQI